MENPVRTKTNVTQGHTTVTFCPNVQIYLAVIPVRVALEHLEMEHTVNNCLCPLSSSPLGAGLTVLEAVVAMAVKMVQLLR